MNKLRAAAMAAVVVAVWISVGAGIVWADFNGAAIQTTESSDCITCDGADALLDGQIENGNPPKYPTIFGGHEHGAVLSVDPTQLILSWGDGESGEEQMYIDAYGTGATAPGIALRMAAGTRAHPDPVPPGGAFGYYDFRGWNDGCTSAGDAFYQVATTMAFNDGAAPAACNHAPASRICLASGNEGVSNLYGFCLDKNSQSIFDARGTATDLLPYGTARVTIKQGSTSATREAALYVQGSTEHNYSKGVYIVAGTAGGYGDYALRMDDHTGAALAIVYGNGVSQWNYELWAEGGAHINSATDYTNHGACYVDSDGTIGHCTAAMDASGHCTCAAN